MSDLFEHAASSQLREQAPLAERLRPKNLDEVFGQQKLLGPTAPLRLLIEKDRLPSLIFWGPPGSGKTTLAQVIAHHTQSHFINLSAVLSGVKELREAVAEAKNQLKYHRKKTLLFVDEIHRFNKAQQDALLPHLETGTLTLIGATTENPSFEVIGPLLSRARVFTLEALGPKEMEQVLRRGTKALDIAIKNEAVQFLIEYAQGDARQLLNSLEIAAELLDDTKTLDQDTLSQALQSKALRYDKNGEEHYNLISAFIKSMRASNPDATIYYLARMYEAGEDPLFLARRMMIFASEDVGLADPHALSLAVAAMQAYDCIGSAEGWIPLSHVALYLARAPKNNSSYQAYKNAKEEISRSGALPTPLQLRNAPTTLMKNLSYGKDYKYAHEDPEGSAQMECLPESLIGKQFFFPKK